MILSKKLADYFLAQHLSQCTYYNEDLFLSDCMDVQPLSYTSILKYNLRVHETDHVNDNQAF